MALVVGTNTYLSRADADAYFSQRLHAGNWEGAADADKDKALYMAAAILDRQSYSGAVTSADQAMAWPRAGVVDREGRAIASDSVPEAVKDAQAELAKVLLTDDLTEDDGSRGIRRLKAGPVDIEYEGRAPTRTLPDIVTALLADLLSPDQAETSMLLVF